MLRDFSELVQHPESFLCYVGTTFALLCAIWLVDTKSRPFEVRLILWGMLLAIFAGGYSLIGPVITPIPAGMLRLGVVMVLGGIALHAIPARTSDAEAKGTDHA